ncbi:acyl-CoA thioesterase [Taibaiella koreensis]|uniref:acyl-CoA thioesterase n=1 Tax=Taibaiella koreensis TaxID=1268548 RepID=UPI00196978B7|nr:acyl-CoA thioesterase [Taibaiella koreensis]
MDKFFLEAKVLWAQIDANMHLRHSAYADFAAQARLEMLERLGMNITVMQEAKIGPILFREESVYLREVMLGHTVRVTCLLGKCREDGSRWSFLQEIFRDDGVLAARIQVDGAWIDMVKRKLTAPPEPFRERFLKELPRTDDFVLEPVPDKTIQKG